LRIGGDNASKYLCRIEQDCHWPAIYQLYIHHGLEDAFLAPEAGGTNLFAEIVIEPFGLLGSGCLVEGRPFAAANISIERELRDGEDGATHLGYGQVHLSIGILEDPEARDFLNEIVGLGFGIGMSDS